jgi:hypothetical protein
MPNAIYMEVVLTNCIFGKNPEIIAKLIRLQKRNILYGVWQQYKFH